MTAAYKHLANDGSFIHRYMEYMDGQETPYSFDFWSAIWLVSCILRRRVYVNRPGSPVWPNMYILLVAPPAVARKTTAVNTATELIQWYMSKQTSQSMLYSGSLTPSMLLTEMAVLSEQCGSASILLALPELSRSFARNAAKSTISFLTDMFDTKALETGGTKRDGTYEIKKASINLLAASTPDWLGGFASRDAVVGGFASRCIYVNEDKPKRRIKWGEAASSVDISLVRSAMLSIEHRLQQLESISGGSEIPIQVSKGAVDRYEEWRETLTHTDDSTVRIDRHVLAVACCLCVSDLSFQINPNHVAQAINAINAIRVRNEPIRDTIPTPKRVDIVQNKVPESKETIRSRIITRLVETLKEAGQLGVKQQAITIKLRYLTDAATLKLALRIMMDYKCVQMFKLDGEKIGRPAVVWRATYLIDTAALEYARKLFVGEPMTANEMDQGLQDSPQPKTPYH